ncbi:5252_t:CDS:2, partial [Acaulospora colombiana]
LNPDLGEFIQLIYAKKFIAEKSQNAEIAESLQLWLDTEVHEDDAMEQARQFLLNIANAMAQKKHPPNPLIPPRVSTFIRQKDQIRQHRSVSLALVKLQVRCSSGIPYEMHVKAEARLAAALVHWLRESFGVEESIFVACPHRIQRSAVRQAILSSDEACRLDEPQEAGLDNDVEGLTSAVDALHVSERGLKIDTVERLQDFEAKVILRAYTSLPPTVSRDTTFYLPTIMSIPRDVQEFLDQYPKNTDTPSYRKNLEFYSNQRRCQPDDLLIEELLEQWKGDFMTLEYEHGFIQWLYVFWIIGCQWSKILTSLLSFPIREHGMNYASQPLQVHEIDAMKASPEIMNRVLRSYKLMLSFYGMTLLDEETGLLDRSPEEVKAMNDISQGKRATSQYQHLVRKILKHLSEMGLERLNAGFLLHVLSEQSTNNKLNAPYLRSSMDRWWANCIRDESERSFIGHLISQVRSNNIQFTRKMYEKALERRARTGQLALSDPESSESEATEEEQQVSASN